MLEHKKQENRAVELRKKGETKDSICKKLKIGSGRLNRILKDNNIGKNFRAGRK